MPSWGEVLKQIQLNPRRDSIDFIRRKYLKSFHNYTKRNVIAYYSGWLTNPNLIRTGISDEDKNSFMATIHKLDRSKGLDLILHTPGGDTAGTDSIINYLKKMFGNDIRAIIPQLAMSAGTMIACACKEIIMGKQSSIGPIDPQFRGIPCQGVIEEFKKAIEEVKKDPGSIPIWQSIISKYHPSFIGDCQNAIEFSLEVVKKALLSNMFVDDPDKKNISNNISNYLMNYKDRKLHSAHISYEEAKSIGLKVISIEDDLDDKFQDLVLTVHHCFMHTFSSTRAIKITENHLGNALINMQNIIQKK